MNVLNVHSPRPRQPSAPPLVAFLVTLGSRGFAMGDFESPEMTKGSSQPMTKGSSQPMTKGSSQPDDIDTELWEILETPTGSDERPRKKVSNVYTFDSERLGCQRNQGHRPCDSKGFCQLFEHGVAASGQERN